MPSEHWRGGSGTPPGGFGNGGGAEGLHDQLARVLLLLRGEFRAAALDGDEPDHLLALADHALRGAVRDVAQRLDDLQHALPR